MARILVTEITAPAFWASALVNNDYSGLTEQESQRVKEWLASLDDWRIVDVARNEDGEGIEARFTWAFDLYGGDAKGGEVLDYVAHKHA